MKWIRQWRWKRYMRQYPNVRVILCSRCAAKVGTSYHGGTFDLSKVDLPEEYVARFTEEYKR